MRSKKEYYEHDFLTKQLRYYTGLPEKQRRHFLAMEYERLGVGSQRYLAKVFSCARKTISKGVRELSQMNYEGDYTRQRVAGGGRKKKEVSIVELTGLILEYLEQNTAGSPTDESVKWTHLRPGDILLDLQKRFHIAVSTKVI